MHNLVPHFVLERYANRQTAGQLQAACLFVDVTGFTALTETLMQQGKVGSEALASLMSALFEPLVLAVYAQDGFIANFAGDAFTALFPGEGAPLRALAAAWGVRALMTTHPVYATPFGEFRLEVRQSLAVGEVRWGIFIPPAGPPPKVPAAYYFGGAPLEACAAISGSLALERSAVEALAGRVSGEWVGNAWQVRDVTGGLPEPQAVSLPDEALAELAGDFLPAEVMGLVGGGEYRPALAVFVGLEGVQSHIQLAGIVQQVFRLQAQYGGFLSRVGYDDKGWHLLLFWGAPRAFENDIERALGFLLDLRAGVNVRLRAGLTNRLTYTGLVGSALRADYVCYAQGTNLAARLMTAAGWGEVWLDEAAAQRTQRGFDVRLRGRQAFKGFDEPQSVYELVGRVSRNAVGLFRGAMVGRQVELAQLEAFAAPIFAGRFAGVCGVFGEPGLGKSRLLHEFKQTLSLIPTPLPRGEGESSLPPPGEGAGMGALWLEGPCDPILRGSLNPVRYGLRSYFEQTLPANEAENKARFERKLDGLMADLQEKNMVELAAELERTQPFLGALVDLHWGDSLYEQLEPKLRFENTLYAVKALIQAECQRQPVILALEDAHWLDADSQKLLAVLTRNMADYPLAILCASRYQDDGSKPALSIGPQAPQADIDLGCLSLEAVSELVEQTLGGAASPELVSLAAEKSEGNPFFVQQLLLDLRERDLLAMPVGPWMLAGGALPADAPTSIQAILLARLDRLTAEVKSVVQAAAVLGREFEVRVLSEMLRSEIDLPGRVRQAEQEAIWSALDELRYLFRHALLRDAAYEMQLRARLRQLHSLAAEAIQQVFTPDLSPYFADLAYHCDKAEDYPQAIDWYHRAAKRAADLYANEEAWGYCSRALQLADEPGVSIIANQKRFDLLVLRESILDRMGHRAEQWADLQAMEAIAQDDRQRCKVLQRKILRCRVLSERPEEKALIEALKQQAQALADPSWLAEAYYTEGLYYTLIDEKSLALSSLEKSLALRQETGDIAGQMDCCCALAIIYLKLWQYAEAMQWIEKAQASSVNQARPEQLALVLRAAATAGLIHKDNRMCYRYATQLLDLATKIGEHKRKASAHFLRGQALCAMFRIEEGFKELNWCLQNEQELGNTHSMSLVLGEIAYQYMSLGDFDLAKDYFQRSMKIDQETNYPHGYCTSLLNLSFIALCQEDAVTAKELYQQGLAVARELGNDYLEAIAIGNLGEAEQLLGEYEASLPHTYRAIELLEKLDQPAEVAIMQIDLAITYLKMGNFELALQFAEKLIAAFPRADADLNDAQRLLWAAARVFHALGQTERAAATLADAYQLYCNKLQQIPEPRMQAAFRQLKFNRQIAAAFEEARWPE